MTTQTIGALLTLGAVGIGQLFGKQPAEETVGVLQTVVDVDVSPFPPAAAVRDGEALHCVLAG